MKARVLISLAALLGLALTAVLSLVMGAGAQSTDPGGLVYSTFVAPFLGFSEAAIAIDSSGNIYIGAGGAFVSKLNSTGTALIYSTSLNGNLTLPTFIGAIAVDSAGNAYVTGVTHSTDFPTTPGAFQTTSPAVCSTCGSYFVAKLNSNGSVVYSTFLDGSGDDHGPIAIAVDSSGNVYITAQTNTSNFPTTPGAFRTIETNGLPAFVAKLNSSGSALVYSTFLDNGGNAVFPGGIAVDAAANAYVAGGTSSTDFPTTPKAFQTTLGGKANVFVTKLNSSGSALIYSTYLGGGNFDTSFGIALDSSGNAYVTGYTQSSNFPTTKDAFQPTFSGNLQDAFVTQLNAKGSALVYSTFLAGSTDPFFGGDSVGSAIGVDSAGNAYVTGYTFDSDFPTTAGGFQTTFGGGTTDVFLSKLNGKGSTLLYSTYLGGSGADDGFGIAVDSAGNAYVTGDTLSANFPVTAGAFQTIFSGPADGFVSKFALGKPNCHGQNQQGNNNCQ